MKKNLMSFVVCVMMVFSFVACSDKNASLSELGTWEMENISNSKGEFITKSNESSLELTCEFKDDNTFLISKNSTEVWLGKYTKEKANNAISLTLELDNGQLAEAVYGIREYNDAKTAESLTLTTNDYIVSFLRNTQ